jgi:hypothetical protein
MYSSDLGKAFNIPIFHCNGDDPLAVVAAFEMAVEWRYIYIYVYLYKHEFSIHKLHEYV